MDRTAESLLDSSQPVRLTESAVKKVAESLQSGNFSGVRIRAERRGGEFHYRFEPVESGKELLDDLKVPCGKFSFYISSESLPILTGSTIDYIRTGLTQAWVIDNPNPAWDSDLAREISKVFEELINPGVAEHGGHIKLVDLKNDIAYVEMSGGCQGCSMAGKTLRHGVLKVLSERFPQITELIDVTNHSAGSNPFFNNQSGDIPTFKS